MELEISNQKTVIPGRLLKPSYVTTFGICFSDPNFLWTLTGEFQCNEMSNTLFVANRLMKKSGSYYNLP